ncbi:tetratricopeptide repeat-containing sensor histidine kinase [Tamlana crocina]|uniref:histidine kinase n=1 Tax=Tamlana crocina TaxID=393006 RepID=A0ABX1DGA7_9FLAO|nr:tetratricopeptide repeat protein [Tamlana crocina]NJX16789.1 tetratricopeptide repeat protein [Tamlana crocina]
MQKSTLSILMLLVGFFGFSQNFKQLIETSKVNLSKENSTAAKAKLTADLAWYYCYVNVDSALVYGEKSLGFSKQTKNDTLVGQSLNDLSTVHFVRGNYPTAIDYARKSLVYRKKLKDTAGIASLYNKMGNNFNKTNVLDSTIYYYLKARDYYYKVNDSFSSVKIESNIAATYYLSGNHKKALEYLIPSILYFQSKNLKRELSNSYITKGNIFLSKNDTLVAIDAYKQAAKQAEESKNYVGWASALNNLSTIYNGLNSIEESTNYIKKAIEIRESIGALGDLESAKLTLAINNFTLGNIKESKEELLKIKSHFIKTDANEKLQNLYETLMLIYAVENKRDSLNFYSKQYKQTLNTNLSESNLKYSQEIEAKYETEKKENEILEQKATIAENNLRINKKNTQLTGLAVLVVVLTLLGYLLFKQQKLKNEQLKKESQLKEALVKIETQNKLQEQRLRISRDLHDNIGAQLTFIISSIENLQFGFKITNEKLTDKLLGISNFTKETISELRDTIWAMNKNAISLEDLQSRISNFIDKAKLSSSGIQFEFMMDESIKKDIEFNSVRGMNIYRIIQEAVNNALKYADATAIAVNVKHEGSKLQFKVTDNGKGFEKESAKSGNGLNNMKKRADEIDAHFEIESKPGNGTVLTLVC